MAELPQVKIENNENEEQYESSMMYAEDIDQFLKVKLETDDEEQLRIKIETDYNDMEDDVPQPSNAGRMKRPRLATIKVEEDNHNDEEPQSSMTTRWKSPRLAKIKIEKYQVDDDEEDEEEGEPQMYPETDEESHEEDYSDEEYRPDKPLEKEERVRNNDREDDDDGKKIYPCHKCDEEFSSSGDLVRHRKRKHYKDKPVQCPLCPFTCARQRNLIVHTRHEHKKDKTFKCAFPGCNYTPTQKQHLILHVQTHTGERKHLCDLCGYTCIQPNDLVVHIRRHNGEKPFKCTYDDCTYASAHAAHVRRHEKTHLKGKPNVSGVKVKLLKCAICNFSSNQKGNLRRHLGTHSHQKPFECSKCDYKAKSKDAISKHYKSYPDHEIKSETFMGLTRRRPWRKPKNPVVKIEKD